MPYDGIVTKAITVELNSLLSGGRIDKIHMPEKNEVILIIRNSLGNLRLSINVNPSMPRVHLTSIKKDNPNNPPMFCMLLRKHLSGGRITRIYSHGYDRIIIIECESTNELGDLSRKQLIAEIMGKHSNLILVNETGTIIDAMHHVDFTVSSVREVMPVRPYILPPSQDKLSPENAEGKAILARLKACSGTVEKAVLNTILGFSPVLAREICFRANLEAKSDINSLEETSLLLLASTINNTLEQIRSEKWEPIVVYEQEDINKPIDFHCIALRQFNNLKRQESVNHALDVYFNDRIIADRLKQSKQALLKTVNSNIDRCVKKLTLQEKSIKDAENYQHNNLYGELITANIHALETGMSKARVQNYYSEDLKELEIELEPHLTPQQNAQKYFKHYNKQKKTYEQASFHLAETIKELEYLQSIELAIRDANNLQELSEIKQELHLQGYIRNPNIGKGNRNKKLEKIQELSGPHEYRSSEGFTIYAGKNNRQNDLLTLKSSKPDDLWLHTQKIPGSHVIIKTNGKQVPDRTLEEAAMLSAWHSRAKNSAKVPVDCTLVRNVKKPSGAKPGMVIYDKYRTFIVTPKEELVKRLIVRN